MASPTARNRASPFDNLGFQPFAQFNGGLIRVWRNDRAGQKAWLTDAILREQHTGFIPTCASRPVVWIPSRGGTTILPGLSVVDRCASLTPTRLSDAHVQLATYEPENVVARTSTVGPALLVLNDVWDPGWRVSVDGSKAESLMVDGAFRAVAVPAGDHEVRWQYETPGLKTGRPRHAPRAVDSSGAGGVKPRRSLADGALH